jgi:hypothetical protein
MKDSRFIFFPQKISRYFLRKKMTENVLKALSSRGGKAALGRHFFGGAGGTRGERGRRCFLQLASCQNQNYNKAMFIPGL